MEPELEAPAPAPMIHPALRRRQARKRVDSKSRRTTVRTIKLVNATDPANPILVQVPIEPGHNNGGSLKDPLTPIRYYLDKGFIFPHEFEGKVMARLGNKSESLDLKRIFCAVSNCWDSALATTDPEHGTERCKEHEEMFQSGEIRYATAAKEWAV